jgi:hypothetical protein
MSKPTAYLMPLAVLVASLAGVACVSYMSPSRGNELRTNDDFWDAYTEKSAGVLLNYSKPLSVSAGPVPESLQVLTVCRGGCATYVRYTIQTKRYTRGVNCYGKDLDSPPGFIDDPGVWDQAVSPANEGEQKIFDIACSHERKVSNAGPQLSP